ncbi:MAG TPA: hypothetical protein VJ801_02410 [Polyangia bacterium]|nr:hypothetical protein [Polyangia bacterium]
MEQPKKPSPGKDIADLKARLGLAKAPAVAPPRPGVPGVPPAPGPSAIPNPLAPPPPPPTPFAPPPRAAPPAAPRFDDPFAAMRPPEGKHFDLRSVDDGRPAVSVRRTASVAALIVFIIGVLVAGAVGFGFGASAVGRRMFNQANFGAKRVKTELDEMQKTITDITTAVNMSSQRLAAGRQDPLAFDYKLIEDLEKVKLDPRPDTSRIFKVNYYLLEDLAIDRLMNFYYDSIVLYGEVERHIKRTKADRSVLEPFAAKLAAKAGEDASKQVNYGLVFSSRGKLAIGTLVEVGKPVCKGNSENCAAADIEGFMIRSNTGANWTPRNVGPKPEGDKVVPIEKTPLFEAVMSGSPDQVRMEQYKQRYNNIRIILQRLAATKKELGEAIDKAAARPDLFTL